MMFAAQTCMRRLAGDLQTCRHLQNLRIATRAASTGNQPGQDSSSSTGSSAQEGPPPDPPSAFATVSAMMGGAAGALVVAGLGVVGVFKLSLWVAGETGRSMRKDEKAPPSASTA